MKTQQEILDLFSFFCELDAGRTGKVSGGELVKHKEGLRLDHLTFMRVSVGACSPPEWTTHLTFIQVRVHEVLPCSLAGWAPS